MQIRYNKEHERLVELRDLQQKREKLQQDLELARQRNDLARIADLAYGAIPDIADRLRELKKTMPANPLLTERIDAEEIAAVVSRWTAIPVSRLHKSEVDKLLGLKEELHRRVVGQVRLLLFD